MSFPRYPKYKDSGVEWLGEVPEHWVVSRLGRELSEPPCNGVSPDVSEGGDRASFSTAAVGAGQVRVSAYLKYVSLDDETARRFLLAQGDVLLLRGSGSKDRVGEAGLVAEPPPPGCVYPDILIRIRMRREWMPEFVVLTLNSVAVRPQMELSAQTAAGIWKISGESLRELIVCRPPLHEQHQLLSFLRRETARIDALISEQERLIVLLEEKRQAVISHAVTKGLNPDVPMKDSGVRWLGKVPAHWEIRRFEVPG